MLEIIYIKAFQACMLLICEMVIINKYYKFTKGRKISLCIFAIVLTARCFIFEFDSILIGDMQIYGMVIHNMFGVLLILLFFFIVEGNFLENVIQLQFIKIGLYISMALLISLKTKIVDNLFDFSNMNINYFVEIFSMPIIMLIWLFVSLSIAWVVVNKWMIIIRKMHESIKIVLFVILGIYPNELFTTPSFFSSISKSGNFSMALIFASNFLVYLIMFTLVFVYIEYCDNERKILQSKIEVQNETYANMISMYNNIRVLKHDIINYSIASQGDTKTDYCNNILKYCDIIEKQVEDDL